MSDKILVPLATLRDMLASAVLACTKDDTLPTLACVYVEYERDGSAGLLTMTSTDRYQLINAQVKIPQPTNKERLGFLLNRKDAEALVKALPKPQVNRHIPSAVDDVTITVENGKVAFEYGAFSMAYETYDGEFPKYRTLMIKREDAAPLIYINTTMLATVAKIKTEKVWRFEFTGSHKPVFAYSTPNEDKDVRYTYMIMPVNYKTYR